MLCGSGCGWLQQAGATNPSVGRQRSPVFASIMREQDCSRWTAYRILAPATGLIGSGFGIFANKALGGSP